MPADRQIVFLAFADARSDLSSLKIEGWSLKDRFGELKRRGVIADVVVEEKATLDRIYNVFQDHRDRIALFHFGGHADRDRLLLESAFKPRPAYAEGLATLLGQQRGLKLVLLNGCSTRGQVKQLLDAGVPAVISAGGPIDDEMATEFAVAFYRALTADSGGADGRATGGCSLARAFAEAQGFARSGRPGAPRDLVGDAASGQDLASDRGFDWTIEYGADAEVTARWSLFDENPLYCVPSLPKTIGWPKEPFCGLTWFTRKEARIFFGRGREIRELYDKARRLGVSGEPDVLLLSGQTGVGKSSVLDAGLLPRLEQVCRVIGPLRRSAVYGLLGTLREALGPLPEDHAFDLRAAWVRAEHELEPDRALVLILDQAEEAYTLPLKRRVAGDDGHGSERVDPGAEVGELCRALAATFDPALPEAERPRGKAIVSFRKEWLDEFSSLCNAAGLNWERVSLVPLDRAGVAEAIRGPAAGAKYHLTIRAEDPPLPEFVADDLLDSLADPKANRESPVAPTLQLLLTRMWKSALSRDKEQPAFDRALYVGLKQRAYELDDVISEQFQEIARLDPEAVGTGLLIDLLEWFTTDLNTAAAHTRADLHARYSGQPSDRLDALSRACQGHYLLVDTMGPDGRLAYRLAHDSLAPLIRKRFHLSMDDVPRAHRTLVTRAREWTAYKKSEEHADRALGSPTFDSPEPLLDPPDLSLITRVEASLPRWSDDQELDAAAAAVVQRSQQASSDRDRRDRIRRRVLRGLGIAAGVGFVLASAAAIVAWVQTGKAQTQAGIASAKTKDAEEQTKIARQETRIAESRRLAILSDSLRPERLDLAALLAVEAVRERDTIEARGSLQRSLDARPEVVRFLHVPEGYVGSVAVRSDGTIAAGYPTNDRGGRGGVVLFDARGDRLSAAPLEVNESAVTSVAFGPDGTIAAGIAGATGGVVMFDTQGHRLRPEPLRVHEGGVVCLAFGPRNTIAAGCEKGYGPGGVVLFDAQGQRLRPEPVGIEGSTVTSVAFTLDGTIAAGYEYGGRGGVMLFDIRGEPLRPKPLEVSEGSVTSVAVGPQGIVASGYRRRGGGGLIAGGTVLFDSRGERLRPEPLKVAEGSVTSVAFSPDGSIAAGYESGVDGGVVLFDSRGERLRPEPLEVAEGGVINVVFTPDGRIVAAYDGGDHRGHMLLLDIRRIGLHLKQLDIKRAEINRAAHGRENTAPRAHPRKVDGAVPSVISGIGLRLTMLEVKEGGVRRVAFGPDGRFVAECGGRGAGAVLFDTPGKGFGRTPLEVKEGEASSVAFGPDRTVAIGYVGEECAGVAIFDASGKRLRTTALQVEEGRITDLALGTEGMTAIGFSVDKGIGGGVKLFNAWGRRLKPTPITMKEGSVTRVKFGPDGTLAAGYSGVGGVDGVVLFDAQGHRLRSLPLGDREGGLREMSSVAFGPSGSIALGYYGGSGSGVLLFDSSGERLRSMPLQGNEGSVTSVDFGPNGALAVGYYRPGRVAGVVLFDAQGERLRPAPLEVKEGFVSSVAFGPAGTLAVGYGGGVGGTGGVVVFDVDPASWLRKAAHVANRNLTFDEWKRYFPGETTYRRTIRSLPWSGDIPERERIDAEAFEKEHPAENDAS
jgi:WD40 repeat protein